MGMMPHKSAKFLFIPLSTSRGLSFTTPSEAVKRYGRESFGLPLPALPSVWTGSGSRDAILGSEALQKLFQLMMQAYSKANLTGDPDLVDHALWLTQSDNLHLLQRNGRSGAEASVNIIPREWQALGKNRISLEMEQVYKNFITALDSCVN